MSGNPVNWIDPLGLDTLGIHSNVNPQAGYTDGHAWLTYTDSQGNTMSYGLWPDDHPNVPNNGPGSDVRLGMMNGTVALYSRYYDLSPDQIKKWKKYISKNHKWRYTNTCASWASEGANKVVGENVDADDWFGFETPRELSQSILQLEKNSPTTLMNPLPPKPPKSSSF